MVVRNPGEPARGAGRGKAAPARRHRAVLARLIRIAGLMARRAERHLAKNGGSPGWRWRESPMQMLDLLTRAMAKLIPLERQAHGLNGGEAIERSNEPLSDAERAHRIAAILEAARARRDRPADPDPDD
jgi:hypothetical protein